MVGRYLAITWQGAGERAKALLGAAEASGDLQRVFERAGMVVLANGELGAAPLSGGGGIVLGTVFSRSDRPEHIESFDPGSTEPVRATRGAALLSTVWGSYVAIVADVDGPPYVHVIRDPSGGLGAYHIPFGDLTIVCSDLQPLLALGLIEPAVDWKFVAHFLTYPLLRARRTGLEGLREILPGSRLTLAGTTAEDTCLWSPWAFAAGRPSSDSATAAQRVRDETRRCVRAWASRYPNLIVELSGGLDSSIVTASLPRGGSNVTCVNLVSPSPDGDERRYARLVAKQAGYALREMDLDPRNVDLSAAISEARPRPGGHAILQALDRALIDVAGAVGASAFFTGAGGDNVFCFITSAAPATDALIARGPGATFWGAIGDLAAIHDCTLWRAANLALKKAARGVHAQSWRRDNSFLRAVAVPASPERHPWLQTPQGALPGKLEHIQAVMGIQNYLDAFPRRLQAPIVSPLLSQPLVELCLGIPSWQWIAGGRNRAVARTAFAGDLPSAVAGRRTKGGLTGFAGAIFERDRRLIAGLLLEGVLARQDLLDVDAIDVYFRRDAPTQGSSFFRLLQILDVELWARAWEVA
jgi:asparagine synthase (glutamine-hydrolysing)